MTTERISALGGWFLAKWRARLETSGNVQHVAGLMRKQGIPLQVALLVLPGKPSARTLSIQKEQ